MRLIVVIFLWLMVLVVGMPPALVMATGACLVAL